MILKDKDELKSFIEKRIKDKVNRAYVTLLQNGTFKLYKNQIHKDVYVLLVNSISKDKDDNWDYNLNNYRIIKLNNVKYQDYKEIENDLYLIDKGYTVVMDTDDNPDSNYNNFTKREIACILLKVPESGSLWLDNLINLSKNS